MNKLNVTNCNDCPFKSIEYNEYVIGLDTIETCVLADFLNTFTNPIIRMYDVGLNENDNTYTPDWCPIKNEPIKISISK